MIALLLCWECNIPQDLQPRGISNTVEHRTEPVLLELACCLFLQFLQCKTQYCINREKVICCQLEFRKITLPTFRLNAPVVIRAKVKEVRNNVAIYSHALPGIHVIGGQRSVRIAPPSLPSSSQRSSNQGLPVLHLEGSRGTSPGTYPLYTC